MKAIQHRRRIKTEEKGVASVWGARIYSIPCRKEFNKFCPPNCLHEGEMESRRGGCEGEGNAGPDSSNPGFESGIFKLWPREGVGLTMLSNAV